MASSLYDRLVILINEYGMFKIDNQQVYIGNLENNYNILNSFIDNTVNNLWRSNNTGDPLYIRLREFMQGISYTEQIKLIKFGDNLANIKFENGYYLYPGNHLDDIQGIHNSNYRQSIQLLDFYTKMTEASFTTYVSTMNSYMQAGQRELYSGNILFRSNVTVNSIKSFKKNATTLYDIIINHVWLNMHVLTASKESYSFRSPHMFYETMKLFYYIIVQSYNIILTNNLLSNISSKFDNIIVNNFNENIENYNEIMGTTISNLESVKILNNPEQFTTDYKNLFSNNHQNNEIFKIIQSLEQADTITDLTKENPNRITTFVQNGSDINITIQYDINGGGTLSINLNSRPNNILFTSSLQNIRNYTFSRYSGTLTEEAFNQYRKDITNFKMNMIIKDRLNMISTLDYSNNAFKQSIMKIGEIATALKDSYKYNEKIYKDRTYNLKDNDFIDEYTTKRSELGYMHSKISTARDGLNTNASMVTVYKNDENIEMILFIVAIFIVLAVFIGMMSVLSRSDTFKRSMAVSLLIFSVISLIIFILIRKLYVVNMEGFQSNTHGSLIAVFDAGKHYIDFYSNNNFYQNTLMPAIDKEFNKISSMKMITYKNYNNSIQYINDTLFNTSFYRELATYLIVLCIIVLLYYIISSYITENNIWLSMFFIVAFLSLTWYTIWIITTRYRTSYKHNVWRDPNYTL